MLNWFARTFWELFLLSLPFEAMAKALGLWDRADRCEWMFCWFELQLFAKFLKPDT
jgi:hypothetical protein